MENPENPPVRKGRPTKYSDEIAERICTTISHGMPLLHAASFAGISHETFYNWQRKHPKFSQKIEEAKARGIAARLKVISEASRNDYRAACWWLEHVYPEHFAKNRIELTGVDGAPLAGAVALYLPQKNAAPASNALEKGDKDAL